MERAFIRVVLSYLLPITHHYTKVTSIYNVVLINVGSTGTGSKPILRQGDEIGEGVGHGTCSAVGRASGASFSAVAAAITADLLLVV